MNGFLAALDNNATPPVNPGSPTGNVVWPSPFHVQVYTPLEVELQARLFGNCPARLDRFAKAIQLLWVVEESVLVDRIKATDPTITYDSAHFGTPQLVGQLNWIDPAYLHATTDALAQLPWLNVSMLAPDLKYVWEHALNDVDKLAAVVTHFGSKYAS